MTALFLWLLFLLVVASLLLVIIDSKGGDDHNQRGIAAGGRETYPIKQVSKGVEEAPVDKGECPNCGSTDVGAKTEAGVGTWDYCKVCGAVVEFYG